MSEYTDIDSFAALLHSDIAYCAVGLANGDYAPSTAVEYAISKYHEADSVIDKYTAVKDAAKKLIADVMAETGQTTWATPAGKAALTAPSMTVSYDAKALDILLRDDADLAMRLAPYRKETERAGTMRITAGK